MYRNLITQIFGVGQFSIEEKELSIAHDTEAERLDKLSCTMSMMEQITQVNYWRCHEDHTFQVT